MRGDAVREPPAAEDDAALDPYQKRLLVFLSVATFFEGYDFIALTQILPNFRADMGIGKDSAGLLVAFINLGTVIAYLLVRRADRWGRRRVLTVTIAGYTVFTFLSGLAPNVIVFAILQMLARIFLIAEWATTWVIAAEEFPDSRRGMIIGVIQGFSTFGAITCAGLVPILLRSEYGWRMVYFVAILPLVILAYARRNLRETRRFVQQGAHDGRRSLFHIWKTPHRKRLLQMGAIWFVAYIGAQNAVTFWKDFAVTERSLTDVQVGTAIAVAAVASTPLVFLSGKLIDVVGRRSGAVIIFSVGAVGIFSLYTAEGYVPLTLALVLGIFASSAFLPVLNAYTTELFPTDLRGDAYAWANNMIGRVGYVLSPFVIGAFAAGYGWGPVIRTTSVFMLIAAALVYWLLPETRSRPLEETSAM